jgi:hypothetical protein
MDEIRVSKISLNITETAGDLLATLEEGVVSCHARLDAFYNALKLQAKLLQILLKPVRVVGAGFPVATQRHKDFIFNSAQ